jgi:valyl-tRNA synthetase
LKPDLFDYNYNHFFSFIDSIKDQRIINIIDKTVNNIFDRLRYVKILISQLSIHNLPISWSTIEPYYKQKFSNDDFYYHRNVLPSLTSIDSHSTSATNTPALLSKASSLSTVSPVSSLNAASSLTSINLHSTLPLSAASLLSAPLSAATALKHTPNFQNCIEDHGNDDIEKFTQEIINKDNEITKLKTEVENLTNDIIKQKQKNKNAKISQSLKYKNVDNIKEQLKNKKQDIKKLQRGLQDIVKNKLPRLYDEILLLESQSADLGQLYQKKTN